MSSVFLCHASEDKPQVEPMQLALAGSGCEVFFDQESLPAGGDYHARIQQAIERCDVFVFVASPASIAEGRFTLSELKFARQKWPSPANHVLPLLLPGMSPSDLPRYLQAATVLSVSGNAAIEVRSAVEAMLEALARQKLRRRLVWALPLVLLPVIGGGIWWLHQGTEIGSESSDSVVESRVTISSREEAVRLLNADQHTAFDLLRTDPARADRMFSDNFAALDAWLARHPQDSELLALAGFAAKNVFASTEDRLTAGARAEYLVRAERMFQQALKLSPDDPFATNGMGNIRFYQDNLDAAIALHRKALELLPNYPEAKHDLELVEQVKAKQMPRKR